MLFDGCVIWAYKVKASPELGKLVRAHGGVYRDGPAGGSGLTHILTQGAGFPDELAFLSRVRTQQPSAQVVTRRWVEDCLKRKNLQPESRYPPPAPPPSQPPELSAAREQTPPRETTPLRSEPPTPLEGGPSSASASQELCKFCKQPLPVTSLVACQPCMVAQGVSRELRLLHLRYFQTPPANLELFLFLQKLLRLREAGATNEAELHSESQGLTIALSLVRACPVQIHSAAELHALLPDVAAKGSEVALFIDQFLGSSDASCPRLRELESNEVLLAKMAFRKIPWVGKVAARELAEAGFRSVQEVHSAFKRGEMRGVELHEMARELFSMAEDCRFMDDVSDAELSAITAAVAAAVASVDPGYVLAPVGGARRGAPGHDIDLMITHPGEEGAVSRSRLVLILEALSRQPGVVRLVGKPMHGSEQSSRELLRKDLDHLSTVDGLAKKGSENISQSIKAFCLILMEGHTPRRLDLPMAPRSQFTVELFGWTGNRQFGRWMKRAAHLRELLLSNHGLVKVRHVPGGGRSHMLLTRKGEVDVWDDQAMQAFEEDTEAHWRSEEELFAAIGVPWRPPSERFA